MRKEREYLEEEEVNKSKSHGQRQLPNHVETRQTVGKIKRQANKGDLSLLELLLIYAVVCHFDH